MMNNARKLITEFTDPWYFYSDDYVKCLLYCPEVLRDSSAKNVEKYEKLKRLVNRICGMVGIDHDDSDVIQYLEKHPEQLKRIGVYIKEASELEYKKPCPRRDIYENTYKYYGMSIIHVYDAENHHRIATLYIFSWLRKEKPNRFRIEAYCSCRWLDP